MKNIASASMNNIETAFLLFQQGKAEHALSLCKVLLKYNANDVNALNLTAIIYDAQNKKDQAAKYFLRAVKLSPKNPQTLTNLAATYLEMGNTSAAVRYLKRAIKADKHYAEAHYTLGNAYLKQDKTNDAKKQYLKAKDCDSKHFKALNNLAALCEAENNIVQAEKYYKAAIAINANFSDAYQGLGSIYTKKEDYSKAIDCFTKVLALNEKQEAKFYNSLGNAYFKLGDMQNAKTMFLQSLSLEPNQILVLNFLGQIYHENREHQLAIQAYDDALKLEPNNGLVLNNLGHVVRETGNYNKSVSIFEEAIKNVNRSGIADQSTALNNLALTQLLLENFTEAWKNYRFRPSIIESDLTPCPERDSLSLAGKKILWLKDQGIGDELFFLRFIPQLKTLNSNNFYRCTDKLLPIINNLDLFEHIYDHDNIEQEFDYTFSLGDIAYLLNHTNSANTPLPLKLIPDPALISTIKETLTQFGPPPYIGFTWKAGRLKENRRVGAYHKHIDLDSLAAILSSVEGSLVSIQVNSSQDELEYLGNKLQRPILDVSPFHIQLDKMLCVLDLIDNYFAVSNTYVHMRESLEKVSHVFVCNPPEWRWLTKGEKSFWLPHCRIYRQDLNGGWQDAVNTCKESLKVCL